MVRIETKLTPALSGRRERRKQVTRKDLLAAGRKLFGTRGLYESPIEDVSSHAGIAKGTLYGYFDSKEALIVAVVSAGLGEMLQAARAATAGPGGRGRRLRGIIRRQIAFLEANPDLLRIFHQARGLLMFDRPEWRPLRGAFVAYFRELGDLLGEGGSRGAGDAARRIDEACALFAALSGTVSAREAFLPGRGVSKAFTEEGLVAFASACRESPEPRSRARRRKPVRSS